MAALDVAVRKAGFFGGMTGASPAMTVDRENAYGEGQTQGYIADRRCG
jgi:hypothetical protein